MLAMMGSNSLMENARSSILKPRSTEDVRDSRMENALNALIGSSSTTTLGCARKLIQTVDHGRRTEDAPSATKDI